MPDSTPFTVHVSDDELARMRRKIEDYALPEREIVPNSRDCWDYGVSLDWAKGLRDAWLNEFDWRDVEKELNRWPQFKVELEGISLHFVHQRSQRPDAIPLLLVHGWPGSFYEFYSVIDALTNPPNASDPAFHVIIPSVPGFLFSSTPQKNGWTVKDTGRLLDTLVTEVLGYASYAIQGGDWGSIIATLMSDYPRCKAVNLNMCTVPPPHSPIIMGLVWALPKWISDRIVSWTFTPDEWRQLMRTKDFAMQGAGYFAMQSTQPLTIGLALNDSPMGLLLWLGEKYHTHVDPAHKLAPRTLLTIISLYYLTHSFASSCLPYRENTALFGAPPAKITDSILGVSVFKHDILIFPRYWIEKWHKKKLVFYRQHERGGHFPALDNPDALVADVREMMGTHRALFDTKESAKTP
ncbi:alpha/beta-hydrolase [Exidia glandulosa HHB12029]|uniref:Alpha/beta-hydrolase n=1 Tax=Exidia glandulosa HHB12029 TaxID=1314781 RepID=A0A165PY46_EXIGL|nr:alpha/beta-hydrolase [Exidia glandulosa HHB12029]